MTFIFCENEPMLYIVLLGDVFAKVGKNKNHYPLDLCLRGVMVLFVAFCYFADVKKRYMSVSLSGDDF